EQRDVLEADGPHAPRAVAELQRQERRAGARAAQVLAQHRERGVEEVAGGEVPHPRLLLHARHRASVLADGIATPTITGVTPPAGASVRPFRALHFDPARVAIDDAIAPPFDVVSDAERAALAARSPYNMVHLILPRPGDEPHVHEL